MKSSSGIISIAASAPKLDVDNRISLRNYYRIANNLIKQADIYREENNVIDLYVMLLRFSSLITETIPCHRDYQVSLQGERSLFKKKLLHVMCELEELKPEVQRCLEDLNRKSRSQVTRWSENYQSTSNKNTMESPVRKQVFKSNSKQLYQVRQNGVSRFPFSQQDVLPQLKRTGEQFQNLGFSDPETMTRADITLMEETVAEFSAKAEADRATYLKELQDLAEKTEGRLKSIEDKLDLLLQGLNLKEYFNSDKEATINGGINLNNTTKIMPEGGPKDGEVLQANIAHREATGGRRTDVRICSYGPYEQVPNGPNFNDFDDWEPYPRARGNFRRDPPLPNHQMRLQQQIRGEEMVREPPNHQRQRGGMQGRQMKFDRDHDKLGPIMHIQATKMIFSVFKDREVVEWASKAEIFFNFQAVHKGRWVKWASYHLEGEAYQWIQWFIKRHPLATWDEFVEGLNSRFSPPAYENFEVKLMKLKQTRSVAEYTAEFEKLLNRVDWNENTLLECFISGLKDFIRD